jgi:transcription termination factor Rho
MSQSKDVRSFSDSRRFGEEESNGKGAPPQRGRQGFRRRRHDRDEPLSIAEQLMDGRFEEEENDEEAQQFEQVKRSGDTHIAELQRMSMAELIEEARKENLSDTEIAGMKRQDLIFRILKERVKMSGLMYGEGTLEILPDGFGFLRSPDYHYLACPDDIYVSPQPDSPFRPANGNDGVRPNSAAQGKRAVLCTFAGGSRQL